MKKATLNQLFISLIAFSFFIFSQCKKDKTDKFCLVERTEVATVTNKQGTIIYYSKYNRYGVAFAVTTANNIDSQVIGLVCSLNKELQVIGLRVNISGVLKKFNSSENMKPEIAGDDLYFFEPVLPITKL